MHHLDKQEDWGVEERIATVSVFLNGVFGHFFWIIRKIYKIWYIKKFATELCANFFGTQPVNAVFAYDISQNCLELPLWFGGNIQGYPQRMRPQSNCTECMQCIYFFLLYIIKLFAHLYIYMLCLSVSPFEFNIRQNGWTDQAQTLCGTLHHMTPGEVCGCSNSKSLCPKVFLVLDFKISRKNILNSAISKIILYCMKSRWSQ